MSRSSLPKMGLSPFRSATTGNGPGVWWFLVRPAGAARRLGANGLMDVQRHCDGDPSRHALGTTQLSRDAVSLLLDVEHPNSLFGASQR